MPRTILTGGCILAVLSLSLPTKLHADSLATATWTESLSIHSGSVTNVYDGQDSGAPEALNGTLGSYYTVAGDLAYGQPGPPFVTAHVSGQFHGQYWDPGDYSATSQATITFEVNVVETQTPPVAVDYVPILVTTHGSVSASSTCTAICAGGLGAGAQITLNENGVEVFNKTETASVSEAALEQVSLDGAKVLSVHPGTILEGLVRVYAGLTSIGTVSGSGTASLGPKFEITSAFIPGTEVQYKDYFQIQYSPGYWALGNPTPVAPTTWGRIKSLYSKP